jgi:two-component system, cell cycle response regulator
MAEISLKENAQVLVILADRILEGLYREKLVNPNYAISWAGSASGTTGTIHFDPKHLVDQLLNNDFDVVILDFDAFPAHPLESLRSLQRISPDSTFIVLNSSEEVRMAIGAFQIGIADYFLKPVNPETLDWSIEKILRGREFESSNEVLTGDLLVFRAAHHISVSESDAKMRDLAMRNLIKIMQAGGGIWVWPNEKGEPVFTCEFFQTSQQRATAILESFKQKFKNLIEQSFQGHLTSHPEKWFRGSYVWIPLRNDWMGGIFLFDVKTSSENATQTRVEFLIRNLEISLDNYRRYIRAKQMAYIDSLTGLYNARYLDIDLNVAIEEYSKTGRSFALLFIDIDHFKKVNDTHGHTVGSSLLMEAGKVLKKQLRRSDHLFRYGGDEFIAILHGSSAQEAREVAERIRANMEKHIFRVHEIDIKITVSIGVSRFPEHGKDKNAIIELADQAMYNSKNSGRNAVFEARTG